MKSSLTRYRTIEKRAESPIRLHASEIASKQFRRVRRGFDPADVNAWLRTITTAYEALECDVVMLRKERDDLSDAIRLAQSRPSASTLRAAIARRTLTRRLMGYSPADVERLVDEAASEIARLESAVAMLQAQLEAATRPSAYEHELAAIHDRVAFVESMLTGPSHAPIAG